MARLVGTATQGGADAFVQAEVQTALQGQTRQAYRIQQIGYEVLLPAAGTFPLAVAALQELSVCLARRSKTAMPNITDVDVIKKWKIGGEGSASRWSDVRTPVWVPEDEVIVVEDPLYLIVDSTATAVIWSIAIELRYEVVTISEVDRLTLLTQSLV